MPMAELESPSLAAQIREAVGSGVLTLPPLPEAAARVLGLLRDEAGVDASRLAELIELDPTMAAAVLRAANSAAFGGLRALSEVGPAVARLGARQVGAVVTSASVKGHFTSGVPAKMALLHTLWDHAVATATTCRRLAASGGGDPAEAFLAGLLHDTGKLLVLKGVDRLEESGTGTLTATVVQELMAMLHPDLGYRALVAWKIPEPICEVALQHHSPAPAGSQPLLLRVQAANAIARKLGAHERPAPDLDLMEVPAVDRLNLGELEVAALMVDVEDDLARIRGLF